MTPVHRLLLTFGGAALALVLAVTDASAARTRPRHHVAHGHQTARVTTATYQTPARPQLRGRRLHAAHATERQVAQAARHSLMWGS